LISISVYLSIRNWPYIAVEHVTIEYRPVWLGLRRGVFTCVAWQVTLCDPIWQVTLRSCEMEYFH